MGEDVKHYLVDASAIMDDHAVLLALGKGGNHVYLHREVITELDRNKDNPKKDPYARGNARKALRDLREILSGAEKKPYPLNNGEGWLHVVFSDPGKEYSRADPALLDYLKKKYAEGKKLILITEDGGLLAQALADDYLAEVRRDTRKGQSLHDILNLPESVDLPSQNREELRKEKKTEVSEGDVELSQLYHNQYLHLLGEALLLKHCLKNESHTFNCLFPEEELIQSIYPRNKEQKYLVDLCLDHKIKIGSALGPAGTGKTLIALAAGLYQTLNKKNFRRVVVIRPVMTIGEELGYLPGDLEQKIDPLMGAIRDASEVIFDSKRRKLSRKNDEDMIEVESLDYLINEGSVVLMTPTYARGRNIPNSFIIVDEAQNLNEDTVKTLATRGGEGSKIIFTGDPYQIDAPYLDQEKNGLVYLTKKLLGEDLFSTVILKKGERSELAELAARKL